MTTFRASILIVDDDVDAANGLGAVLESRVPEAEVWVSNSGRDAMEVLRAHEVHLILADYRMPVMDGLEFLKAAIEVAPQARRVLMTGNPDLLAAMEAVRSVGLESFLVKPLDVEQVLDLCRAVAHESAAAFFRHRYLGRSMRVLAQAGETRPESSAPSQRPLNRSQ